MEPVDEVTTVADRRRCRVRLGAVLATIGSIGLAYGAVVRPWQLRWGASDAEVTQPMPGDGIIAQPHLEATRAITVDAPPSAVWPWLVQMGGYTRAGWYSYDRIDNAGVPSATDVLPHLQDLQVGDVLLTSQDGTGFRVESIDPPRSLVLAIRNRHATTSVSILLEPGADGRSRLVFRLRLRAATVRGRLYQAMMDVGDFVMMRRQLLGIRDRAEERHRRVVAGASPQC